MSESNNEELADAQPLLSHLIELRSRLLKAIAGVFVVFIPLAVIAQPMFTFIAEPLLKHLPKGSSLIATQVVSPFFTPFKLAIVVAVAVAIPWVLYQVWAFVAPGLYQRERRLVVPLLASSTFLFYAGMAFAYFVLFPIIFGFIVSVAPTGVAVMTDISHYLNFVLAMFMAFGLAFELPIAIVLVVWTGFVTPAQLAAKRPYVVLVVFVVGMLLTPPNVIAQILLAVPLYLLYEAGIIAARILVPAAGESDEEERDDDLDE